MRQIRIGDIAETVVERADYPPERLKAILGKETVAVLGYGVQGRGQSLNMKDNGVNVIIGLREKSSGWDLAQKDGWVPGKTLFPLEEAARRGTIVQYLLSDAGQKAFWPTLKPYLTAGKALYFSHGFSIVYRDQTAVVPPPDIDGILVAPKGSGTTVRRLFLEGVQRDGRGGDAEPLPADRRERHGLDVRQLLDDGPARRPGLVRALPRRRQAGVRGAVPEGRGRRRDAAHPGGQQPG